MKITTIKELQEFAENPFLESFQPSMRRKNEVLVSDDNRAIINTRTGEIDDDSIAIARVKIVDSDQFVKVYVSELHIFFDLSRPAQRVVEFLLHQVSRAVGRGEVLMHFSDFERFFVGREGGSRQTFMRGLQELAAKRLIAKSLTPNIWFINPTMTFNGDRMRFITEYRRRKVTAKDMLEQQGQSSLIDLIDQTEA